MDVSASHVARRLRRAGSLAPVVLACERPDTIDVALALAAGADDCLLRPLDTLALAGRIAAHVDRSRAYRNGTERPDQLAFAGFEIELAERRTRRYGHPLSLTRVEFDLLAALASRTGQVVSRGELLRLVWGYSEDVPFGLVDPRIRRLQRRLEDEDGRPVRIEMLPGQDGYRFSVPAPADHIQVRRRPVAPLSGLPDRGPQA
jgi:DNA-binding response OmpR family regulator